MATPVAGSRFAGSGFEVLRGLDVRVRYASASFAVTEWQCHEHRRSVSTGKHQPWHVLGFVHGGSFRLDGPRGGGVADASRLIAFRAEEEYETAHPSCCGDYGSAIAIAPSFAAEIGEKLSGDGAGDVWRRPLRPLDARLFARQLELLRRLRTMPPDGDRLEIEERLFALVSAALTADQPGALPLSARQREDVAAAQETLEQRFAEPLPLHELARAVGLSPFELCRLFRRGTGSTVHGYRTRLRLAHGLERLAREPRARLVDLALDLGFDSHSHFTEVFRRSLGRTPSAFRAAAG